MKKLGIHFRLLLAAFLLISATTSALGYIGVNIIHNFVFTRYEERILFLARYLALNAELGILIDERAMLNRLAQNLLSEKDVTSVTILNQRDEALADVSKKVAGPLSVVEVPVSLKEYQDESRAFQWVPGGGALENIVGKVRITYSTEGINRLLGTLKSRFILLAALLAAVAVIIFYFISRSLVAPITQVVRAAREVAQGNLNLRTTPGNLPETRELVLAFNAMLDSIDHSRKMLEEANQKMIRQKTLAEMGKFSMMIAHEFKNPLSIIKSSLDILKKDIAQPSDNMMVAYIEDEIKRLNRLIEDFLLFSRPAMPTFRLVEVNAMLTECLARFQLQMSDRRVEIQADILDEACHLNADPDLLVRAVNNVLKNAFEANGEDGTLKIRSSRAGNCWCLEVKDRGEGIPSDNLLKIFDPFFTTRSKGTGLGLAYVSQVVKTHGGTIAAANRKGGGASFRIELPIRP